MRHERLERPPARSRTLSKCSRTPQQIAALLVSLLASMAGLIVWLSSERRGCFHGIQLAKLTRVALTASLDVKRASQTQNTPRTTPELGVWPEFAHLESENMVPYWVPELGPERGGQFKKYFFLWSSRWQHLEAMCVM